MDRFSIRSLATAAVTAAALFVFSTGISAQSYIPTPVTISKEKVRIDGKVCYSHIVLERQTLYSISKAYNVSIEDIYRFNPTLKETGLKKNGIIIIPSEEAIEERAAEEQEQKQEQKQEPKQKPKRKTHTVKWFEDLDVIAEKYGISVEALMRFNNLESRKLTARQKLVIPTPEEAMSQVPEQKPEEEDVAVPVQSVDSTSVNETVTEPVVPSVLPERTDVRFALLLPFKATGTGGNKGNLDFYSGVLLAVSDMAGKGIDCDLQVLDIADGNLPSAGHLSGMDFLIGPVSPADISAVIEADQEGPALISPLDQRAQALTGRYRRLIQSPTPHSTQYRDLIKWVTSETSEGDKVIFVTEKGARLTDVQSQMQAAIDSSGTAYRNFSYSILEGRDIMDPLMALMTPSGANRVVIASESEAFVNDVVRNLNLIEYQKYDVVLYAPSKIRSFETIDVSNIHNTSLHSSLAYLIDYEDDNVKNFLLKYRAMFNTEPTQFAFQGYDIASYFIDIVSRYGDRWTEMLESEKKEMLQSRFAFCRNPEGGYTNTGVRRVVYEEGWGVRALD